MDTRAQPRVCLSMIVRNEAAIIARCLTAAAPIIDAAVICDTGSTDETPRICRDLLAGRGVTSHVVSHVWQNFGANRTAALDAARTFAVERGWALAETYWLFLDADHELVVPSRFTPASLAADAIALRQESGSCSYWNVRLARANLDWRAVGATHEYYDCPERPEPARLDDLWIRDHGDGGSKANKIARDIALLTAELDAQPANPRTLFYLAQSYAAAGDPLKALILYRRRIAAGGTPEETWYAKLAAGRILAASSDSDAAIRALTDAFETDPARAEPLYEIAKLHRRNGRGAEAAEILVRARAIRYPSARSLFIHRDVYEHGLDEELARAAAGTPYHARGFEACERLVLSRRAPAGVIDRARVAELAYVAPLDGCQYLPLRPTLDAPYRACNPSVVRTDAGYLVNCRAVNYEQRRLRYRSLDPDGAYRTRNVLMTLDRDGVPTSEREVILDESPLRDHRVRGLEDVRLVETPHGLLFTCTTADRHPSGRVHQSIAGVDADGRVTFHRPLVGARDDRTQKNWLPFVTERGELGAIYAYDPITILRLSIETGRYDVVAEIPHALNASAWHGSAGPLRVSADRRLLLVHDGVHRQGADGNWERVYTHRFVECDDAFRLRRVSKPFVFAHKGVEFACGLAFGHDPGTIVCAIGIEDREAYLCRMSLGRVDAWLEEGTRA